MSDIFREVDEAVRHEQLKKLWEKYNAYVIALLILIVAGVGGWRGYQWWQGKLAAEAGHAFSDGLQLSEQGKSEDAEAAFAKLIKDGTASYRALASFREAAELAKRDPKAAVELYDSLAKNSAIGADLQNLATLRAGYVLVDTASYDDLRKRIEPLTAADKPYRHGARALLALAAWRANDAASAKHWFDMILADNETPSSTRSQVDMLMALFAADGKS